MRVFGLEPEVRCVARLYKKAPQVVFGCLLRLDAVIAGLVPPPASSSKFNLGTRLANFHDQRPSNLLNPRIVQGLAMKLEEKAQAILPLGKLLACPDDCGVRHHILWLPDTEFG